MSYQTTQARITANATADTWHDHKTGCPVFQKASRQRRWSNLCAAGSRAFSVFTTAAAELATQRHLDRHPAPGQETLI